PRTPLTDRIGAASRARTGHGGRPSLARFRDIPAASALNNALVFGPEFGRQRSNVEALLGHPPRAGAPIAQCGGIRQPPTQRGRELLDVVLLDDFAAMRK